MTAGLLSPGTLRPQPFLPPFSLRAQRPRATRPLSRGRPSGLLPCPSRLPLCPAPRAIEALPPETKRFASRALVQAFPKGRKRDGDCRAACGTSRFYPKTDRARARYKQGREPAGLPAGDGRGCSVGRPAPSSTRLALHGVLTTKKGSMSYGKHSGSYSLRQKNYSPSFFR